MKSLSKPNVKNKGMQLWLSARIRFVANLFKPHKSDFLKFYLNPFFTSEKQDVIDLDDDESLSKDCKPGDGKHILFPVKSKIFLDITY